MTRRRARRLPALVLTLAWPFLASAAEQVPPPAAPGPQGLEARLRIGERSPQKVVLLGRKDGKVVYHFAENAQVISAAAPAEIRGVRMALAIDKAAVAKARRAGDYASAAATLGQALGPTLPFLDLKDNNALPYVLRAGCYFLLAAEQKTGCRFDLPARAAAEQEYLYAHAMFTAAMAAEWSERADAARMRAVISLVGLGRIPAAAELLDTLAEPDPGDDLRGLYSLARAEVLHAQGHGDEALEAVIGGLVFADKDIEAFPTSLLLAAHCYALREDWYRARDVTYEVARLFPGTHWDGAARVALAGLMAAGRTRCPSPPLLRPCSLASMRT
jgi:tetratricopeptide (TPR) repeat protein